MLDFGSDNVVVRVMMGQRCKYVDSQQRLTDVMLNVAIDFQVTKI